MAFDQSHGPYFEWKGFVGKYRGERGPEPYDPPNLKMAGVIVVLEFCFNRCLEIDGSELTPVKVTHVFQDSSGDASEKRT